MPSFSAIRYLSVFVALVWAIGWSTYKVGEHYLLKGPSLQKEAKTPKDLRTLVSMNSLPQGSTQDNKEFLNSSYLYLMGQYWSNKRKAPLAIQSFEKALQLDPDSADLNLALAKEYLAVGRVQEGIESTQKAINLNPKDKESRMLMGNLQVTAKKYSEARVHFQELYKEYPEDEEILLTWVLLEIEDQNYAKGHSLLRSFLKDNPSSAPALFYLGRLEQSQGNLRDATKAFEKALEIQPSYIQAATYLAVLKEEMGYKDEAIELYRWLADETDEAGFDKRVAQLYMDRGLQDKALQRLLSYESKEPSDLNNKVKIALIYIEKKNFDEAIAKLEEILKLSPESDNIRFYLAAVYQQKESFRQAAIQYGKVSRNSKLFPEALRGYVFSMTKLNKGKKAWKKIEDTLKIATEEGLERAYVFEIGVSVLEENNKVEEALDFAKRGLELYPQNLKLRYQKATMLEKLKRVDEAVSLAESLLEEDPENVASLNFVGYLLAERGEQLPRAEKLIRKALSLRPNDPYIMDSLGWALYKQSKYAEALKYLKTAYSLKPDESIIASHLGDVLLKKGELAEALTFYEKALKLGPDDEKEKQQIEAKLSKIKERLAVGDCAPAKRCAAVVLDHRTPAQTPEN